MTVSQIAQMCPMRMIVLRRTSALASTCSGEALKNSSRKESFSSITVVKYRCPDGQCLDSRRRCDGYEDCRYGRDHEQSRCAQCYLTAGTAGTRRIAGTLSASIGNLSAR